MMASFLLTLLASRAPRALAPDHLDFLAEVEAA